MRPYITPVTMHKNYICCHIFHGKIFKISLLFFDMGNHYCYGSITTVHNDLFYCNLTKNEPLKDSIILTSGFELGNLHVLQSAMKVSFTPFQGVLILHIWLCTIMVRYLGFLLNKYGISTTRAYVPIATVTYPRLVVRKSWFCYYLMLTLSIASNQFTLYSFIFIHSITYMSLAQTFSLRNVFDPVWCESIDIIDHNELVHTELHQLI